MGRKRAVVRWQDGSTEAGLEGERYREINGADYSSFIYKNAPYGVDEFGHPNEAVSASPDVLSDETAEDRNPEFKGKAQPSAEHILLEEAKRLLTEKQAAVWQAVMVEEYTEAEAANVLGVAQQTISRHLAAGRKKIASYLRANAHRLSGD